MRRPTLLVPPVSPSDHVRGSAEATLTLVEYGDFECPFCGRAYPELKRLIDELAPRLRFVFRHFPLREQHPHAEHAAEAAEAAAGGGKFWEMHDLLYEHQASLDDAHLLGYAKELGLDPEAVRDALARRVHRPRVREDFESGVRSGVSGTPMFFVNGRRHEEPGDVDTLAAALRRTL